MRPWKSLSYMDFYNEALSRDSLDARVNIEVAKHYIRQGSLDEAERHLLRAQKRLAHDYTRAYNTEAHYYLGYIHSLTDRPVEAEENFWAATYTPAFKHPALYQLALMKARSGDLKSALGLAEESLLTGAHDLQALTAKANLQRRLGHTDEARATIDLIRSVDPLDRMSEFELAMLDGTALPFAASDRRGRNEGLIAVQEMLEAANNYLALGDRKAAGTLLDAAVASGAPYSEFPVVGLYRAYVMLPDADAARKAVDSATGLSLEANFPHRTEEIAMFEALTDLAPDNAALHYLFGNLLYYLGQKERGLDEWKEAVRLDPSNAMACRNAGFAEGVKGNLPEAIDFYDMAINANPADPMLLTESDKLREQAGIETSQRLRILEKNRKTVMKHDDAVIRLLKLYNLTGNYSKASRIMADRHFHLWEGGGEIHSIFVDTHLLNAIALMERRNYSKAIEELELARQYPVNLEVAPSQWNYDAKALYLKGKALKALGRDSEANEAWEGAATAKARNFSDLKYYQTLALRQLGRNAEADAALGELTAARDAMAKRVVDNYAKFGDADKSRSQSNMLYIGGLIESLNGNHDKARNLWAEAINLYPGNIWARQISNAR